MDNKINKMPADYNSKHGTVSRMPQELYMAFVDMRNFANMLPEDKKASVKADYDNIEFSVQGFNIGVRVKDRIPFSKIEVVDNGAPFHFDVTLHFDSFNDPNKTDFWINVTAELNMMMKMMLGSKIKEALDKVVDGLVDASEGRMPAGMDPSKFNF